MYRNMRQFRTIALITGIVTFQSVYTEEPPRFGSRIDSGIITEHTIDEASGIAASQRNPGILWTHNDSGGEGKLYALGADGSFRCDFLLAGIKNRDWEDIAVGPGPQTGVSYLYIGEIGDNNSKYPFTYIYRFPEPTVPTDGAPVHGTISTVATITVRYPESSRDAETLMVDPKTRDIWIISKREKAVRVYKAAYPQNVTTPITLEFILELPVLQACGGDIASNGATILVKNYLTIYYWRRDEKDTIETALARPASTLPYIPEAQGEAVCWDYKGEGYYTISEQKNNEPVHLYYYPRIP
jgi:hypothetical protein